MKARGILFSAPMVRAILEGRKTQTRRVVKPQPQECGFGRNAVVNPYCTGTKWPLAYYERRGECWNSSDPLKCPYGAPGDQLWVRETWAPLPGGPCTKENGVVYRADQHPDNWLWKSSIHMPRWASRITLEIEAVRVERLNDISEEDAKAEGVADRTVDLSRGVTTRPYQMAYSLLWESIHGTSSWDANPWVWVIQFRRVKP